MSAAILVIGATGTTGKELVKLLAKNGHKTRVTVRPTSNTSELQALGVELVQADLNDFDSLVNAMNGIQKYILQHLLFRIWWNFLPRLFVQLKKPV